jgi:hypothetical protein
MAKSGQRKCLCCGTFFDSDHRNRKHQLFCSAADCRRASKAASQARWVSHPDNVGHFKDPLHVARAQAWREAHPDHARGRPRKSPALQDSLIVQAHDSKEEKGKRTRATLQELLNPPSPLLVGIIAHLFAVPLQEDLVITTRLLVQFGRDILGAGDHAHGYAVRGDKRAL